MDLNCIIRSQHHRYIINGCLWSKNDQKNSQQTDIFNPNTWKFDIWQNVAINFKPRNALAHWHALLGKHIHSISILHTPNNWTMAIALWSVQSIWHFLRMLNKPKPQRPPKHRAVTSSATLIFGTHHYFIVYSI